MITAGVDFAKRNGNETSVDYLRSALMVLRWRTCDFAGVRELWRECTTSGVPNPSTRISGAVCMRFAESGVGDEDNRGGLCHRFERFANLADHPSGRGAERVLVQCLSLL